jgi:molybdenum-dependent DNA-binding transcriptional regulator ModE
MSARYLSLDLIAAGVAGLRSVTDEGDELLHALESLAAELVTIREQRAPVDENAALAAVARCGTVARAARELGVPRSTLRYLLARRAA